MGGEGPKKAAGLACAHYKPFSSQGILAWQGEQWVLQALCHPLALLTLEGWILFGTEASEMS